MRIKNNLLLTCVLVSPFVLTSCLKTAAEIQREQEVEQALVSARESNSIVAEMTAKNKELQEQMSVLQGRVDEVQQKLNAQGGTNAAANTTQNTEQFLKLVADVEELKTQNAKLQKAQEENQEYIKKLESLVKGLTTQPIDASTFENKDKTKEVTIEDAEKLLGDKKYNEVLAACKELLNSKATDGKKNRCRFAQGIAHKELKQFDEGLLSLSQIYTDWPKSTLAPNALLEISHILELKGQSKESQLMLKKLINEYPKTNAAKDAKKLVK
jgi:TolA-binding protein